MTLKYRPEFFLILCNETNIKSARLTKAKFKAMINKNFGEHLAEKLCLILDFSKTMNFEEYLE
jgi:hypothetical protein